MAPPVDRNSFVNVLNAELSDPFRLAIRGHAGIEAKLDQMLDDAFPEGLPAFLRRTGFSRKVELVVALGLVPRSFADPIGRLTRIRNAFSHGDLADLDEKQAFDLVMALPAIAPALDPVSVRERSDASGMLLLSLGIIWFALDARERAVRAERERVAAALAAADAAAPLREFMRQWSEMSDVPREF